MRYLYIVWFYALRFVTCKVSVFAFSLLYFKLSLAKLSLFVFGALFVTSVCRLLSLRGLVNSAWDSKFLDCSTSQIRILHVAEFLLIRGLFLLFLISLDRAAFRSCSRNCLRSAASLLCEKNI